MRLTQRAVVDGALTVADVRPLHAGRASTRRRTVAHAALGVMLVAGLAIVVGASAHRSFLVPPGTRALPAWLGGPFTGVASGLTTDKVALDAAFCGLIVVMFAAYLTVVAYADTVDRRWGLAAAVGLQLIFLCGPALWATDVFNYVSYARLDVVHGLNPYVHLPAAAPHDPTYSLRSWHHLLSPYGPLFTIATFALVPLGLIGGYWALKVAVCAATLACLWLVWKIAQRLDRDPLPAVLLVGLNPLVVVFGSGGVHNDALVMVLVLAAVYATIARKPARAGVAAIAAAGLKASAALVLPFMLLGGVRRARMAVAAVASALMLGGLSVAVFGLHGPSSTQSVLAQPLSAANILGLGLGLGGETPGLRIALEVVLALTILVLLLRTARGADWIAMAGWATVALIVALNWEEPWYVLWVLPFAALSRSRGLVRATLLLSAFLFVTTFPIVPYTLTNVCHCYPDTTAQGARNWHQVLRYLR